VIHQLLADLVIVLHLLFILFAIFGGLLVLKKRWIAFLHIPAVLWGGFVNVTGGICPLTPLEVSHQIASGQEGYEGGFIEHYLEPIVYMSGTSRTLELSLGIVVVVWNVLIYSLIFVRLRKGKQSR